MSGRESAACRIASRHNHYMLVFRAWGVVVVWTGCGQRAVYTTRKHGGLADSAVGLGNHGT